jgi:ABC-type antimicrobial peptide transport system permease subunit
VVLAAIGLFGVTAFAVGQRRREIGIRLALGAGRGEVVRLVFGQGMKPVIVGLTGGLVLAALVLLAAASLGVVLPARGAAHVDLAAVLKEQ